MARRRKGGIKSREIDPASNQFPKFSIARNTQGDSQSWVEKRRGREEREATWWRKRRVKRGKSNLASNQFPMCSPQSGALREVHGVT